jgi:hypothetical protein
LVAFELFLLGYNSWIRLDALSCFSAFVLGLQLSYTCDSCVML